MDVNLANGAYVSKCYIPCLCLKTLATNLALNVYIDSSVLYFLLNTHLFFIGFNHVGRSTKIHIRFDIIESISPFTASLQNEASLDDMTSLNVFRSSSILSKKRYFIYYTISISFNQESKSLR